MRASHHTLDYRGPPEARGASALPALSEAIRTAHQEVKVAIKALEDAQSAALSRLQEGDDGIKDVPVAVPG